jgi:hypothetical protein
VEGVQTGFLLLILYWKQGQKLGKLYIINRVLVVLSLLLHGSLRGFLNWFLEIVGQSSSFISAIVICASSLWIHLLDFVDQHRPPNLDIVGPEAEAFQHQCWSLDTQRHQVQPSLVSCPYLVYFPSSHKRSLNTFCMLGPCPRQRSNEASVE